MFTNATPRVLYTVEDGKGTIYTAHTDKAQAVDDGENMVSFATENGMEHDFWVVSHTLQ